MKSVFLSLIDCSLGRTREMRFLHAKMEYTVPVFREDLPGLEWLVFGHVDRNPIVLESYLREGEDEFTFRMNVGIEQDRVVTWS